MIRIEKPAQAPKILQERGRRETQSICDAYNSGKRDFNFKSDIYAAKSVKNKLKKIQHDKCCFCESKISHNAYGDVEHFRPKGGYRQEENDPLTQPGYYWLAYEWTNLFLSCQLCNQRFKRNLFPLEKSGNRAINHEHDISLEDPLFIDPSLLNPEEYISFRKEIPYAIDGNSRGAETIKVLGLDRRKLNEQRWEKFDIASQLYFIAMNSDSSEDRKKAQKWINKQTRDSAEYAAMIRAAIESGFILDE
ncbi:MAG: hypothetical protein GY749_32515 [Desulfobacteraceae bacterium]|nr:hypothetical protein [Desulfobacteraceae bacterium]